MKEQNENIARREPVQHELYGFMVTRQWVAKMLGVTTNTIRVWQVKEGSMQKAIENHCTEAAVKNIMNALVMGTRTETLIDEPEEKNQTAKAPESVLLSDLDPLQKRMLRCLNVGIRALNTVIMEGGAGEEAKAILREAKKTLRTIRWEKYETFIDWEGMGK